MSAYASYIGGTHSLTAKHWMWCFVAATATSALLCVFTGTVLMMRAATRGSVRAQNVLTVVIPLMPPSIGFMMVAALHCHDVMSFVIMMRNIAAIQDTAEHDELATASGTEGVNELVRDIAYAQEPTRAAICPICLDCVQGVHLLLSTDERKVRVKIRASRVVVCRVCRQVTHVTCMLRYLLQWNSPQKCPMCNSALHA